MSEKITAEEMEKQLAEIVIEKKTACEAAAAALDKDAKTEKKALMVQNGMYSFCLNAGLLYHKLGERANAIKVKSTRMERFLAGRPAQLAMFREADEEEKLRITACFYPTLFFEDQVLPQYRGEYDRAAESGSTGAVFEMNIKIGTVTEVLDAWKAWRLENGYGMLDA